MAEKSRRQRGSGFGAPLRTASSRRTWNPRHSPAILGDFNFTELWTLWKSPGLETCYHVSQIAWFTIRKMLKDTKPLFCKTHRAWKVWSPKCSGENCMCHDWKFAYKICWPNTKGCTVLPGLWQRRLQELFSVKLAMLRVWRAMEYNCQCFAKSHACSGPPNNSNDCFEKGFSPCTKLKSDAAYILSLWWILSPFASKFNERIADYYWVYTPSFDIIVKWLTGF